MTRLAALLVLAALLAPAAPALAQQNPFGPLPPAAPAPTPTPEEPDRPGSGGDISRGGLLLIGLGVVAVFVGFGVYITRDARRALPDDERAALSRRRDEGPHRHGLDSKARARKKAKAQRAARRKNR